MSLRSISRRRFLRTSAAAGAFGLSAGSLRLGRAAVPVADPQPPAPLSELDAFNYVVGTQTFDPAYQFTTKPKLLETAEAIRSMGSSVIKFRLDEQRRHGKADPSLSTLRDFAARDAVVRQVFNMTFGHYLLWVYPVDRTAANADGAGPRDEEIYDLACYLLKVYSGTRKMFYLGHWEGDWELRGRGGSMEDPTPQSIAHKIRWLNRRQQAVDEAKRDTPHRLVNVFCYAEANRVADSMQGKPGMANSVIPQTQIDYVSYSSYDTSNAKDAEKAVPQALDYIESKLPPKAGIPGRRVWIGEYGYPAIRYSAVEQAAASRRLIRTALQWGCPFALYWEMFNNEVDKDGKQKGFWLIDDKGARQPVFDLHQRFLQWARDYVATAVRKSGRPPTFDDYRRRAVAFLDRWPPTG